MIYRGLRQSGMQAPTLAKARPLRAGDEATVWPTLVHRAADGTLQARIEAWIFERERNTTRTRLLARALGLRQLHHLDDPLGLDRAGCAAQQPERERDQDPP